MNAIRVCLLFLFYSKFWQILASTIKNFLLLDLGLSIAFPTIVIPALTGLNSEINPNETIQLTAVQASWLGSIGYVFEPLGSFFSGLISEPLGRKKAMFLVNIPHLIGWLMLYYSTTLTEVFVAHTLLGLGKAGQIIFLIINNKIDKFLFLHRCWSDGSTDHHLCRRDLVRLAQSKLSMHMQWIQSIFLLISSQKSIRGILIALSGIAATLGLFIVFLLGSLTEWRNVALYCLSVPIITMVAVCFIPETPL